MDTRCAFCEFFDGGGLARVAEAIGTGTPIPGDCLNSRSPRFQTTSHGTCDEFYPDDHRHVLKELEARGLPLVPPPVFR